MWPAGTTIPVSNNHNPLGGSGSGNTGGHTSSSSNSSSGSGSSGGGSGIWAGPSGMDQNDSPSCQFSVDNPHPGIYLVLRFSKLLRNELEKDLIPYFKPNAVRHNVFSR